MTIPDGLRWWRTVTGGADWLDLLPRLVGECAEQWSLEVRASFEEAHVSLVTRVGLPDGTTAVLKINFPDAESEQEPGALEHWNGKGAVRLMAYDGARRALLVERCRPGTTLLALEDEEEAIAIAAGVLGRLCRPPPAEHVFRPLSTEAERWVEELPHRWQNLGRPFERELLDEAVSFLRDAGPTQGELELDRGRMRGWGIALAWGMNESVVLEDMIACARWLAESRL